MPGSRAQRLATGALDPARLLTRLVARGHTLTELEGLLHLSPGYLSKLRHGRARPSPQLLALLALMESNPAATLAALRAVARRAPVAGRALDLDAATFPASGAALPALLELAPELDRRRVPWALAGAVALEAHGVPRETRDVDIYVDDRHRSAINVFRDAGLGIAHFSDEVAAAYPQSGGENDRIDVIFPRIEPAASVLGRALQRALRRTLRGVSVPVLPPLALATIKLMSARAKEHADALRLIDAGLTSRRALRAELMRLAKRDVGGDDWARRRFDPTAALARLEGAR